MNESVQQAYKDGELNDYFFNQLNRNLSLMPEYLHSTLLEEAKAMSAVGVDNVEDQKIFLFISMHVPDVLGINRKPSAEEVAKVSAIVYHNRNIEGRTIDTLMNLFKAINQAADELLLKKLAYPQGYNGKRFDAPYDISRWIQATRDIYSRANQTGDFAGSFAEITDNWNKMEKLDYQAWLRFHQEGAQHKYKTAQYYDSNDVGYILPNPLDYDSLKAKVPHPLNAQPQEPKPKKPQPDINDARTRIEQQRSKIIGRLNAAEKLLSSLDGQFFAGDDQEYMLKLLQDLKRKVQTSNKLSVKSTLFEDFIYKTANMLKAEGKVKAGRFFYKVAQAAPEELLPLPPEGSEEPVGGAEPMMAEMGDGSKEQTLAAIKEFFKRLETGVSNFDYDEGDVKLTAAADPYQIIVEAQEAAMPAQPPVPEPQLQPEAAAQEAGLEVSEDEIKESAGTQVDDVIDSALQNITIKDVIDNLEMLASFYKKREMSRQLSFVDIMMDRLGIGSFFPEMGEAMSKGLEANQYIGTRIETVLSRLRGVIGHPGADKMMEEQPAPAETAQLRRALEQEKQREEERKQRRREKEEAKERQPTAGEQLAAQAPAQPQAPQPVPAPPQAQPLR